MYAVLSENIDTMTFNTMICQANKMGLLASNLEKWDIYRQRRNLTSHTYNEDATNAMAAIMDEFLQDAKFLINKLKEKID